MMNNPLGMIFQMMQGGGNPQQVLSQMMNNSQFDQNPMVRNAMQMYQSGDIAGLNKMAENLAKEKNTTVDEVKNSIMQRFGMN